MRKIISGFITAAALALSGCHSKNAITSGDLEAAASYAISHKDQINCGGTIFYPDEITANKRVIASAMRDKTECIMVDRDGHEVAPSFFAPHP